MPGKENRQTAVVVEKTYDSLLWLLPKVEKSQRSFRFTLGDRMVTVGLDLLLALVEAGKQVARTCRSRSADLRL